MVNVFVAGCRVRLTVDFQILDADLIPAGVTGVVVSANPELFAVRLDDRRAALERRFSFAGEEGSTPSPSAHAPAGRVRH